jgi:ubiquinone/menaquinone biosynthesis C-methylase UbiE
MAWTYDAVASLVSLGRWRAWINVVLPFLVGPRILEIGYGTGHLMASLSTDRAIRAVGLDESRQMARLARRRVALPVPLLRGMAQRLPFCAESFETVVSTFPSEYISDTQTASEIYRVLAPGGRLVILPLARTVRDQRPSQARARLLACVVRLASGPQQRAFASLGKTLSELGFQVSTHLVQQPLSVVAVVQAIK